jgi:hypothetical protein
MQSWWVDAASASYRAVGGADMSAGLYRLRSRRFNGTGGPLTSPEEAGSSLHLKSILIGAAVLVVLLIGAGAWLMMSGDDSESADAGLTHLATDEDGVATPSLGAGAMAGQPTNTAGPVSQVSVAPDALATSDDKPTASIDPSPVSGLKIGAQSWQRGGLGSKALVTFTLRNENRYAVKDVVIACAFSRRDGSHLTDRKRVLPGSVHMKSRKSFAGVHVGFVNVNASKAKCTLVAASKI